MQKDTEARLGSIPLFCLSFSLSLFLHVYLIHSLTLSLFISISLILSHSPSLSHSSPSSSFFWHGVSAVTILLLRSRSSPPVPESHPEHCPCTIHESATDCAPQMFYSPRAQAPPLPSTTAHSTSLHSTPILAAMTGLPVCPPVCHRGPDARCRSPLWCWGVPCSAGVSCHTHCYCLHSQTTIQHTRFFFFFEQRLVAECLLSNVGSVLYRRSCRFGACMRRFRVR